MGYFHRHQIAFILKCFLALLLIGEGSLDVYGGESHTRTIKCGRDCAYTVCRLLGVNVELEEIDAALGHKEIVSFSDLDRVITANGLHCLSVSVPAHKLRRTAMRLPRGEAMAIARLPGDSSNSGHFVLLWTATNDAIEFADVSGSGFSSIPFSAFRTTDRVFLLLVGTNANTIQGITAPVSFFNLVEGLSSGRLTGAILLAVVVAVVTRHRVEKVFRSVLLMAATVADLLSSGARKLASHRVLLAAGSVCGAVAALWGSHAFDSTVALRVEPTVLKIGPSPVGSSQLGHLRIHNCTRRDIELADIKPSCSCMDVDFPRAPIKAGGTISVRVRASIQGLGVKEDKLFIVPANKALAAISLPVYQEGYESAQIMPNYISIGDLARDTSSERVLTLAVENLLGNSLSMESIAPLDSHSDVKGDFDRPLVLTEGSRFDVRLTFRVRSAPGPFQEKFVLTAKQGEITRSFGLAVVGHVAPAFSVEPKSVFLVPEQPSGTSEERVVIMRSLTTPIELADLFSDYSEMRIAKELSADCRTLSISLKVAAGQSLPASATLTAIVRRPVAERVVIPVFIGEPRI